MKEFIIFCKEPDLPVTLCYKNHHRNITDEEFEIIKLFIDMLLENGKDKDYNLDVIFKINELHKELEKVEFSKSFMNEFNLNIDSILRVLKSCGIKIITQKWLINKLKKK